MAKIIEGVNVSVDGHKVKVKGPNGELEDTFSKKTNISIEEDEVVVSSKSKALVNTIDSIIQNMMVGVTEGYSRKLKLLYAHFPVSVEIKGKNIFIKNFLGEKEPRKTKIAGDTKVEVKGQEVTITGPDKQAVGQTMANMKSALKIRKKDPRIFQDGIYEVN